MHRILIHASAHVVSHYAASVLTEILNSNDKRSATIIMNVAY